MMAAGERWEGPQLVLICTSPPKAVLLQRLILSA